MIKIQSDKREKDEKRRKNYNKNTKKFRKTSNIRVETNTKQKLCIKNRFFSVRVLYLDVFQPFLRSIIKGKNLKQNI